MKTKLSLLAGFLVLAVLLVAVRCRHQAAAEDVNLIVNGDAEAGEGSADGARVAAIPGWTPSGAFTVVRYNATGGFISSTAPGPANRGRNYFAGGPSNPASEATQEIDVSALAGPIDERILTANLSGYLGGYAAQNDHAILTAEFRDAAAVKLGTLRLGPVMADERDGRDGLLFRQASAAVPAGTRKIVLILQMTRTEGEYNDGYADNLALVLTRGHPAPASR